MTFEEVSKNNAMVAKMLQVGMNYEDMICVLVEHSDGLVKQIIDLQSIAPKKWKTPDGYAIWRCPDELVPMDDYTKYSDGVDSQ